MFVVELQPKGNAIRGVSPAAGNPGMVDEYSLVAKAKCGHDDAFGELYRRHQRKAYRMALRILRNQQDAEDAVQSAFQRALVDLQRFREDSTFLTWLTRIVINEALMLLRKRRTREPLYENRMDAGKGDGGLEIADGRSTAEEILYESERSAALLQAIGRLGKKMRIVVLHRELQGLTSAETARRLGLTIGAVKGRTFHARRLLRKHLERNYKSASALSKLQKSKA